MHPTRPLPRRLLAALLMALAAAPACAGQLRGSIVLGGSPGTRRARAHETVVWLEQVPEKTEQKLTRAPARLFRHRRPPPPLPLIVESGQRYRPRVTAIAAGSALVIRNMDHVWHGPFSVSPARAFDLGKCAPGRSDTLRFDRTGVVALRCDIHPGMSAFVVVTPNHAFTQPDTGGDWRLPDLPAGHYVVHVWRPEHRDLRQDVDVPARGSVTLPLHW